MDRRSLYTAVLVASSSLAIAACSPEPKAADPAAATDVTAAVEAAPAADATASAAPASAAPGLFDGIAGVDSVPAALLPQMMADTAPHWARCGDDMVTQVMSADGKPEGFIVARGVSFTFVDAAIDVPSQKQGVTSRRGINLRSASHFQFTGEGVSRTDNNGRPVVQFGWGPELRLTAPLPHWRADEANGAWQAMFRPNATDADQWKQRYRAADCAALPPMSPGMIPKKSPA